ncbi:MAG: D-cysteine desulfhydrase [Armatimonadetes bacterium]|nr:MAG: D-cysteine desulfhydrase [Armatimonadota bacterium]
MPRPDRIELILKPTPCHPLLRASERLGIELWVKRDDLTGFALGGNKGRKLEYLMADVLRTGADVVVASGAAQSNFVRQLGAACARFGIRCVAAVMDLPYYVAAGKPASPGLSKDGGNVFLDAMLGVELRYFEDGDWKDLEVHSIRVAEELASQGLRVYRMAVGGSSVLSALAFREAAQEAQSQAGDFDGIVTPSSSGSTHAGIAYHFAGSSTRVIGISADPDPENVLAHDIAELSAQLDSLLGERRGVRLDQIDLRQDWAGEGYSVPSEAGARANEFLARAEGLFLDPVYTSKAFAGLMELARTGELRGKTLFWHTGGYPTIFTAPGWTASPSEPSESASSQGKGS